MSLGGGDCFFPRIRLGKRRVTRKSQLRPSCNGIKLKPAMLSQREKRAALTYFQLIEVAVVAAFRKSGVPLRRIRAAREWSAHALKSEHPFAEYRFKEEARHLWLDSSQVDDLKPNRNE